ncbi:MAG TPA: GNAT family N-acetyltransferase [Polyangiaceae bacterium]
MTPDASESTSSGMLGAPAGSTEQVDQAVQQLLYEAFPIPKFSDMAYLRWLYFDNPLGPAFQVTRREGGRVLAHIGGHRQRYHRRGQELPAVETVNLAVAPDARGRGLMVDVNRACLQAAFDACGDGILVTAPNVSSTHGYMKSLGCHLLGPLPVRVLPPLWPARASVQSVAVNPDYLASRAFDDVFASLDYSPAEGFSQRWSADQLRFRLANPHARYAVHIGQRVVLISTSERRAGVPVCVILKSFVRGASAVLSGNAVAAAACRFYRAPAAIYAGYSDLVRFAGVRLPERLKPSPLNLCVRSFRPGAIDETKFVMQRFELLDLDAF